MSLPKKESVSCARCKGLWIGVGLGGVAVFFIAMLIFNPGFYFDNGYFLGGFLAYFLVFGGIFLFAILAIVAMDECCREGAGHDTLFGSIFCFIITAGLIMLIVQFLPMFVEESVYLSIDDSAERLQYVENEMSCKTFLQNSEELYLHNESWGYSVDLETVNSVELKEKWRDCK